MDRRTTVIVALAVLVGVAAVILVVVALTGDDEEEVGTGDDTTTTTDADTTTTTEGTTTTAPAGDGEAIAAVDSDGRVVILDAGSGDVEQVLLEGVAVDDPAKNGIDVVPGGDVFVTRPGAAEEPTELVRVPPDGSATESLGEGIAPSVSPDGSRLAYVRFVDRDELTPSPVLVVRDLDTGDERELAREAEQDFQFIPDTAWTADGERVAFVAGEIFTGLYVVDADAASLDEAERIGPVDREEGTSWSSVAAFGEDTLAVVETCCDATDRERWLVLAVNLSQREAEGGLVPGERVDAFRVDSPGGEARLVYVTGVRPGGGTLHRWDGSGEPEVVSEGIVVAAW